MPELIYRSAAQLAAAIRRRELGSREIVDACLARIDEVNPAINAVVQRADDRARAEADACDREAAAGRFRCRTWISPCAPMASARRTSVSGPPLPLPSAAISSPNPSSERAASSSSIVRTRGV